jgi:uncharacterized membrane protein YozB (DUF420 family)
MSVTDLPIVNASLNACSGVLITAALFCIRAKRWRAHAYLMIAAVAFSLAFLTCYVIYHVNVEARSLKVPSGWFRTSYFVMLITHVILAAAVLPMVVVVLVRTYQRKWDAHRKLARPTFWVWLYVSVTGVLIYLVLYHVVPTMYPESVAGAVR